MIDGGGLRRTPVSPEDSPLWDAGSAELASWIISDANQSAATPGGLSRDGSPAPVTAAAA